MCTSCIRRPAWRAKRPDVRRCARRVYVYRLGEQSDRTMQHNIPIFFSPPRTWHLHVYSKPPGQPTPHSITDILGLRHETRPAGRTEHGSTTGGERRSTAGSGGGRRKRRRTPSCGGRDRCSTSPDSAGTSDCRLRYREDSLQVTATGVMVGGSEYGVERRAICSDVSSQNSSSSTMADLDTGSDGQTRSFLRTTLYHQYKYIYIYIYIYIKFQNNNFVLHTCIVYNVCIM